MATLFYDSVLKFFSNRKIQKSDLGFEIQQGALPITQATAYVDKGYIDNNPPYMNNIDQAITWVASRGGGRIVVSSNFDTITLLGGVHCYLEPGVNINYLIINQLENVFVSGEGYVETIDVDSSINVNINLYGAKLLNMTGVTNSYVELTNAGTIGCKNINGNKFNIKSNVLSFGILGEGTNTLYGSPLCNRISVTGSGVLNMYNAQVIGEPTEIQGVLNAFDCEFSSEIDSVIKYTGRIMLQGCWLNAGEKSCIFAEGGCDLILDDTKLFCVDVTQPSVESTDPLIVRIYGNSVSRTAMSNNCSSSINPLVVDSALQYKYF